MGLNNISSGFWKNNLNKAQEVINGFSIEKAKAWATANLVQSSDELAGVARATMQRKNTVLSNLELSKFDELYSAADKSNADYVAEFGRLQSSLNAGNTDQAMEIASGISDKFGDKSYLQYLQEAEGNYNAKKARIDAMDAEVIRSGYIDTMKEKIAGNKTISSFTTSAQQEKLASAAYKAQGLKNYFNTGDAKTNQIRMGVAAGGYMGTAMVVRGLQGGTPLTNEYGERDIAGIPFI